jgi:hypothetical protein
MDEIFSFLIVRNSGEQLHLLCTHVQQQELPGLFVRSRRGVSTFFLL